jgi:hypothetical protein
MKYLWGLLVVSIIFKGMFAASRRIEDAIREVAISESVQSYETGAYHSLILLCIITFIMVFSEDNK